MRGRSTLRSATDDQLRALGVSCAAAAAVSFIGLIAALSVESERLLKWSGGAFLASVVVPYLAMRWHLAVTDTLTEGQKRTWRGLDTWGLFGFIMSFFYLTRSDRRLRR